MPQFILYADQPHTRRADGVNTVVVVADDAASAPAAARALVRGVAPDAFNDFRTVALGVATEFAVEGSPLVGRPDNAEGFPTLGRGGQRTLMPA